MTKRETLGMISSVMVLADFGVAFVIVTGLATLIALIARGQYRRKHPPLTPEEKTAQLERKLAEVNQTIEEIDKDKWDT